MRKKEEALSHIGFEVIFRQQTEGILVIPPLVIG
jgi:hypothetical protein